MGCGTWIGGHQHAERRAARLRIAFDDAAVVADDLGNKGETKAGTIRLGGDERLEEMGDHVLGHASLA